MSETASFLEILGMSSSSAAYVALALVQGLLVCSMPLQCKEWGHSVHLGNLMPVKEIPHLTSHSV